MNWNRREVKARMDENEISRIVVDTAFHIHKNLGPGLLESVDEVILSKSLKQREMTVERKKAIPIEWEGSRFDEGFPRRSCNK